MKVHLITAKYSKRKNRVREHRVKITSTIKYAENWLNKIKKPAMFYIVGGVNTDRPDLFQYSNKEYRAEWGKISD